MAILRSGLYTRPSQSNHQRTRHSGKARYGASQLAALCAPRRCRNLAGNGDEQLIGDNRNDSDYRNLRCRNAQNIAHTQCHSLSRAGRFAGYRHRCRRRNHGKYRRLGLPHKSRYREICRRRATSPSRACGNYSRRRSQAVLHPRERAKRVVRLSQGVERQNHVGILRQPDVVLRGGTAFARQRKRNRLGSSAQLLRLVGSGRHRRFVADDCRRHQAMARRRLVDLQPQQKRRPEDHQPQQ